MRFTTKIILCHFSLFFLVSLGIYWGGKNNLSFFYLMIGLVLANFIIIKILLYFFRSPLKKILQYVQHYEEGKEPPPFPVKSNSFNNECNQLMQLLHSLSTKVYKQIQKITMQRNANESLLESLEEGIVALDKEGIITFANQKASDILQKTKTALIGSTFEEIKGKNGSLISTCKNCIQRCIQQRVIIHEAFTGERKHNLYHIEIIASLHSHNQGIVLIFQDRSHDYKILGMGKDFVANASHELRTPIMIIQGYAETLQQLPMVSKDLMEEILAKIMNTAKRLSSIINNLLTLADIENYTPSHFVSCNVIDLVEEACHILETVHKNLHITFEVPKKEIFISADRSLMELAIYNILENAVKYSEKRPEITIKITTRGGKVRLAVQDNGIGIPFSDMDHIFERFYRVDKARSRQAGGAGLGLSIVKTIVEKHQGKIDITSSLGMGSCFTMQFPQHEIAVTPSKKESS